MPLFQECKEFIWHGKYIFFLLKQKLLLKYIDLIVTISDPIADEIKKTSGLTPMVIKNGVDMNIFIKEI